MKRVLLFLIIFSVFGIAFALFAFPTLAQIEFEHQLILDMNAKVVVNLPHATEMCGGTLSLYSPTKKELLSFPASAENLTAEIGTFAKGEELVLSFTPEPNTPCPEQTILSNDPNHFFVLKITSVYWYAEWEIPGTPTGFGLKFYLTPTQIGKHHPAIFIHGLGGYPTDWTTGDKRVYFDTLKVEPYNYSEEFLHAYEYADADGNPETYDNQGDVTLISQGLENEVNRLAELYQPSCTENCLDIVGFSLGGIVARDYLNNHPTNHKVRKLITIASPHEGAWIFNPENWVELIPGAGKFMRKVLTSIATTFLQVLGQNVNLNSPAAQQVRTGSDYLDALNDVSVETLHYDTAYGDIDTEIRQKIFFFELKKKLTIGDGYIMPESATGIPATDLDTYGFSDELDLKFDINVKKTSEGGYELAVDPFSLDELNYHHGKLVTHPDVVSRVIELLTSEE